ncbi:MAG: acyltransferase family protein [Rikenellaceae bacterium]|nr:acyltransferase family protein [Rikenellaceae bacterium]
MRKPMTHPANKRIIFIDLVKAFAIILVVLGHCIQYGSGNVYLRTEAFFDNILFKTIYSFHMPLFMLISGYLFAHGIDRKSTKDIATSKFRSLIIPIFCWAVVPLIVHILHTDNLSILSTIEYYLTASLKSLWFLWAVFWLSLIVTAINKLFKDNILVYLLLFLILFIVSDNANLHLYKYMYPFFVAGYLFNKNGIQQWAEKIYTKSYFMVACGILFLLMLYFYNNDIYIYKTGHSILNKSIIEQLSINSYRYTIGFVGSIFVLVLLYQLYNLPKIKEVIKEDNRLLTIGQKSMGIYIISTTLLNGIILDITRHLSAPNYLFIVIETLCVIFTSLLIIRLIGKHNGANRLLLGAK